MFYGLLTNTKDNTKRESDFSDLQMCANMDSAIVENDDARDWLCLTHPHTYHGFL